MRIQQLCDDDYDCMIRSLAWNNAVVSSASCGKRQSHDKLGINFVLFGLLSRLHQYVSIAKYSFLVRRCIIRAINGLEYFV